MVLALGGSFAMREMESGGLATGNGKGATPFTGGKLVGETLE